MKGTTEPLLPKEVLEQLKDLPEWKFETGITRKVTFATAEEARLFVWNVAVVSNNLCYSPFEMVVTRESVSIVLQMEKATTPCAFDFVYAHALEALIQGKALSEIILTYPSLPPYVQE